MSKRLSSIVPAALALLAGACAASPEPYETGEPAGPGTEEPGAPASDRSSEAVESPWDIEAVGPGAPIPDGDATGVASPLDVRRPVEIERLEVVLDIDHGLRSDLRVTLTAPWGAQAVVLDHLGGERRDIHDTFRVDAFTGRSALGRWTLTVVDDADQDRGSLDRWILRVAGAELGAREPQPPATGLDLTAEPGLAIPDGDPAGATATLDVLQPGTARHVEVTVAITHPYVGDLRLWLVSPEGTEVVLRDREGGSADDIRATYVLDELAGETVTGRWRLRLADVELLDGGRLDRWTLRADLD